MYAPHFVCTLLTRYCLYSVFVHAISIRVLVFALKPFGSLLFELVFSIPCLLHNRETNVLDLISEFLNNVCCDFLVSRVAIGNTHILTFTEIHTSSCISCLVNSDA